MQIEAKTRGHIEYFGKAKNESRTITIEKVEKGYVVRSYKVVAEDLHEQPQSWEYAYALFQELCKQPVDDKPAPKE